MSPSLSQVLLVEDDRMIAQSLQMSLPFKGFEVTVCETWIHGMESFQERKFDLVLLDVQLPGGSGVELCREFRKINPEIPILMVTARTDEESAVLGLEAGADDYVRKPYGVLELSVRMKRLIQRKSGNSAGGRIKFGPLQIDESRHVAWAGDSVLTLGKREFDILALLIKKSGNTVTRNEILNALGDESEIYDRTIDSHLSHVRRKIKESGVRGIQITAIYGVGYRLDLESNDL